ncbi:hypothetical protein JTE90_007526 [Oedothorax gibbosus]|uniref:Histone H2A n=1 Tax=Oedothorax gibbosus TaxID=931172 RepID=A0AAV6VKD7_9ARAC|nr:hypothetical protein JTE90_007526 [Oedothorax gibbosus]
MARKMKRNRGRVNKSNPARSGGRVRSQKPLIRFLEEISLLGGLEPAGLSGDLTVDLDGFEKVLLLIS